MGQSAEEAICFGIVARWKWCTSERSVWTPQSRRHKTMPVVRTVSSISNFGPIATRLTGQSTAAPSSDFQSSKDST